MFLVALVVLTDADKGKPLFSWTKNYPLKGEIVLVMTSISKDVVARGNPKKLMQYYLPHIIQF